jgi:rRNA maturation endonuclease Nob1
LKRLELIKGQDELQEATKYVLKQKPEGAQTEAPAAAPSFDAPPPPPPAPAAEPAPAPAPAAPATDSAAPASQDDAMSGTDAEGKPSSYMAEIQKFAGKLGQELRDQSQKLESDDIKYVLNMVISAVDLNQLSDEDKEDVLSKFESDEESDDMDMGMEDMGSEDITGDSEVEDVQADMDVAVDQEMGESSIHDTILDSIFSESKIDKVISKYFEMSDSEKKDKKEKMVNEEIKRKSEFAKKVKSIENLSETIEQELSSKKFLQENKSYIFLGKTNKKNLVFENKSGQVKISPEGFVI